MFIWYVFIYYDGNVYVFIMVKICEGCLIYIKGNVDYGFMKGVVIL